MAWQLFLMMFLVIGTAWIFVHIVEIYTTIEDAINEYKNEKKKENEQRKVAEDQ